MKKEIKILKMAGCILKKFFFNNEKTDFYHECKEAVNNITESDEEIEEYIKNYQSTTRWQTV